MKVRKKPDLLTILALIVSIGVLISAWTQLISQDSSRSGISPTPGVGQKAAQLYRGNFIKVSSRISSPAN